MSSRCSLFKCVSSWRIKLTLALKLKTWLQFVVACIFNYNVVWCEMTSFFTLLLCSRISSTHYNNYNFYYFVVNVCIVQQIQFHFLVIFLPTVFILSFQFSHTFRIYYTFTIDSEKLYSRFSCSEIQLFKKPNNKSLYYDHFHY